MSFNTCLSDTFLLVHVRLFVFPQGKCTLHCTVPDIYVEQPLSLCLYSSDCFHLYSFLVVRGKISTMRETERKREHPVSESLSKNNAVCFQLRLSAGDIMSCVTPAKARNCCSQYLAVCISLYFILSHCELRTWGLGDVVAGSSLTQYIFTWTSSAAARNRYWQG